jgi:hypothetical protein
MASACSRPHWVEQKQEALEQHDNLKPLASVIM